MLLRRIGLFASFTSFLMVAGCGPAGEPEPKRAAAGVAEYAMEARQVADGVYAVITPARDFPNPENRGWNSNSGFVVTDDGVLVVDTGSSTTIGKALRAVIAGVTDQPVRWIVNTHGHGDHWLGNAGVADENTEIIASSLVKERASNNADYWIDLFNKMTEGATGQSAARAPNSIVDDRITRTLGGVTVEFIPSGDSHSPGDLIVWVPQQKVLITGDVVYSDRAPSAFDAKIKQWIATLGQLEALAPQVVIPGHGGLSDAGSITREREYFQALWSTVKEGYDAGKPDYEILPTVKERLASYRDGYPGFDDKIGPSVSHVYLQVEQEGF
jgi:glyoxylase-like metal-dependent hydrolase (beta-lactamase superfamily II)